MLDGLEAHGEDHLDEIVFAAAEGPVRLQAGQAVRRAARSPTSIPPPAPPAMRSATCCPHYRADPRMGGAITFAMNAIVVEGIDCTLTTGMSGRASYAFA